MTLTIPDAASVSTPTGIELWEAIPLFQAGLLATIASATNSAVLPLPFASYETPHRVDALERLVRISTDPEAGVIDWDTLARVDAEAWGYADLP